MFRRTLSARRKEARAIVEVGVNRVTIAMCLLFWGLRFSVLFIYNGKPVSGLCSWIRVSVLCLSPHQIGFPSPALCLFSPQKMPNALLSL